MCKYYNTMLFVRNHLSECLEVHLQINLAISEVKLYLMNFILLNIHEAYLKFTRSLLDLGNPLRH